VNRAALNAAKLGALVRDHTGEGSGARAPFPGGAALVDGDTAWVLLDERPERGLGRAMAWASSRGFATLHVLADEETGVLARRAWLFAEPPTVWRIEGRALVAAEPDPPLPRMDVDPYVLELGAMLADAGAEVVIEHGDVIGEVLGLEIARVVIGTEGPRIEVGVGRHDREAFAMLHGDLPTADALAKVIATVEQHRYPGAEPHPLNRMAAERWLRQRVIEHPAVAGMPHASLSHAAAAVRRVNLKEPAPAVAAGIDAELGSVVVVCSVGVDPDLVPAAADARLFHDPDAALVLVVPERDALRVTRDLAAQLAVPASVVTVPGDWRTAP
jgi:hypothetical protein